MSRQIIFGEIEEMEPIEVTINFTGTDEEN
jgi:hypothetical protein